MRENTYSVYMHVNKINSKKYIGATKTKPSRRWNNGNGYQTQPFFKDIVKYGWNAFNHIIVASGLSRDEAMKMEHDLVEKYKTTNSDYGYNVVKGGLGPGIMDNETKSKIRNGQIKAYADGKRKAPMLGKHHTNEAKKKISEKIYKTGKYSTLAI